MNKDQLSQQEDISWKAYLNETEKMQLETAEFAFAKGDFQRLRELTEQLILSDKERLQQRAKELRKPTQIDAVQVGVIVLSALFFAWVFAKFVL